MKDCHNCGRAEVSCDKCTMRKENINICLQDPDRPFWYPKKKIALTVEILEALVVTWAYERGIYEKSTEYTRLEKVWEEMYELKEAMLPLSGREQILEEIKLEAGDVIVTLINLLHPLNLNLQICLDAAYEKIKNRTGKMIDGQFVRDKQT